jgi:hypothetical protein
MSELTLLTGELARILALAQTNEAEVVEIREQTIALSPGPMRPRSRVFTLSLRKRDSEQTYFTERESIDLLYVSGHVDGTEDNVVVLSPRRAFEKDGAQ